MKQHSLLPQLPCLQQPAHLETFVFQKISPGAMVPQTHWEGLWTCACSHPARTNFFQMWRLPKEHHASHGEMADWVSASQHFALHAAAVPRVLWHDLAGSLDPVGSAFEGVMHWDRRNAWSWDAPQPGSGVSLTASTQLALTAGLSFCSPGRPGHTLLGKPGVLLWAQEGSPWHEVPSEAILLHFSPCPFHCLSLFLLSAWSLSLLCVFVSSGRTVCRCWFWL